MSICKQSFDKESSYHESQSSLLIIVYIPSNYSTSVQNIGCPMYSMKLKWSITDCFSRPRLPVQMYWSFPDKKAQKVCRWHKQMLPCKWHVIKEISDNYLPKCYQLHPVTFLFEQYLAVFPYFYYQTTCFIWTGSLLILQLQLMFSKFYQVYRLIFSWLMTHGFGVYTISPLYLSNYVQKTAPDFAFW